MSIPMSVLDGSGRAGRPCPPRWPALLVLLGLMACTSTTPPEANVTEPAQPSLYLELASTTGNPVPEAMVSLPSGQRQLARGTLLLEQLPVGTNVLGVQAQGHYPTLLKFDMAKDIQAGARLELIPLEAPLAQFDASKGVEDLKNEKGNITLDIPEGSLRDAQGNPIQGQVDAFLTSLDLEGGQLVAAPGVLEGIPVPGARPVGLESLGMVALVIQQEGKVVSYARGIRIRGSVPNSIRVGSQGVGGPGRHGLGTLSASALPRVVVWRLEPSTGLWVPTGDLGQLVESSSTPGALEWEVTLDNPSTMFNVALPFWWRSPSASPDNPLQAPEPAWVETACLEVQVEDEQGMPAVGRMVMAQGVGYMGLSRGLTNADGIALLEVMRDRSVQVDAGEGATTVPPISAAGNCKGGGAKPTPFKLRVAARICTPGASADCAYSGPEDTLGKSLCRAGRKSCNADGTKWSTCEGEVLPQKERCDNALDDDCDGATNEACDTICQEGETRPCYDGPEGTEGVGQCRGGTRTCMAGGRAWSACTGQVLPQDEDCSRPQDENCDGVACLCWPGGLARCGYTGPAHTEGVGACRASLKACNATGTGWGTCTDEVTPLAQEDCTTPGDDDCDGVKNEGSVCICAPSAITTCAYGGPTGTENVGVCRAGTQTCNASGTAWSACTGEVTPQSELCTNGLDDNCNGQTDDCAWTLTNAMNSRRFRHKAQVLSNGKVLVAGGTNSTPLASAELYDPVAKTWSTLANSMNAARINFTMTLLNNGKVLVAGGIGPGNTFLASAEEYDPGTETWSLTKNPLSAARADHTATLLNNGKVLVAGGQNGGRFASAEVYDPDTREWSTVPNNMNVARAWHTATLLNTGKVLVAGGESSGYLSSSEEYDPNPSAQTWTLTTGALNTARALHVAELLNTGKVLVAGGENSNGFLASSEEYDPGTRTWAPTNDSLNTARTNYASVRLSNGKVLVTGGYGADDAELYDPASRTWKATSPLQINRGEHAAVLLNDGQVLICGGYKNGALTEAELYPP